MIAQLPPMGWNTWNTFGTDISEDLVLEMADVMVREGYRDKGYRYIVLDDGWALKERDASGNLVPDPAKFPHGIRGLADAVHARGLKLGIYSCAGIFTCAGYPSSYDHEYEDARLFASWGVDFLKYDFCNFPENANGKNRYLTMSMALRASGREILFSACNWGTDESWNWMRSIGAHMYRSTGDIFDNYQSFLRNFQGQVSHFNASGPFCFNDIDMLTVGMGAQGNVAIGRPCTDEEYRMQFALWCLAGTPLFLGADLRKMPAAMKEMVQNPALLAINQDPECRPPLLLGSREVNVPVPEEERGDAIEPLRAIRDQLQVFLKLLSDGSFVLAFCNLFETEQDVICIFSDLGIPYHSGMVVRAEDVFTGETREGLRDYLRLKVPGHACRLFRCRMEALHG